MKDEIVINVGENFSRTPAGRYLVDGPYSGERFRTEKLIPALASGKVVKVDLSGVIGYGSSFLEEVFGGVIRLGIFSKEDLMSRLIIFASDPRKQCYVARAQKYMNDAWAGANNGK